MEEVIQDAFLVACIVLALLALCIISIVLRKMAEIKSARNHEDSSASSESSLQSDSGSTEVSEPNGVSLRSVLMSSLRCCEAKKLWKEKNLWSLKGYPSPLLGIKALEGDVEWQSHSSDSPVWQRPILMGEKCEFPRFSGVILYDENGHPLQEVHKETSYTEAIHQDTTSAIVRTTTLRDLL